MVDEASVFELVRHVERWALREVEGTIAERLCGQGDFVGENNGGGVITAMDCRDWIHLHYRMQI